MAIYQKLKNLNAFYRETTGNKVILNDLDYLNMDDLDMVNDMLMTIYNEDTISIIPSCSCGESRSVDLEGTVCPECGTIVKDPQEQLEPVMWLKQLDNRHTLMNPHYWQMMKQLLSKKLDYVRWLCDTSYNPPGDIPGYVIGAREIMGGERNYLHFIHNIEKILIYWANSAKFKKASKQESIRILLDMYKNQRDAVFTKYLPVVNKKLFVMENTTKGRFTNLTVSDMIDLIMLWIKNANMELSPKKISSVTATVISKMAGLYAVYFKEYLVSKPGIFRKHVYSARSHFTFRAVITSIPGKHRYDELVVPWPIGVTAFRPHVLNKLIKRGYTYKKANALLYRAVNKYDQDISEILDELISDSGNKLYVILQRNPSLTQSSALFVKIGSFRKDPKQLTLGVSHLIVKNMNGDYDGDALNITILLDDLMADQFKNFECHYNIPDATKPFGIAGTLGLLSSVTSITSNYLDTKTEINPIDTINANLARVNIN